MNSDFYPEVNELFRQQYRNGCPCIPKCRGLASFVNRRDVCLELKALSAAK